MGGEDGCSIIEKFDLTLINFMHIHVSGIEYGLKGEKRHLSLNQSFGTSEGFEGF